MGIDGIRVIFGIYIFYESSGTACGQYYEDPKIHFTKLSFDLLHRGSFNNTECLRELLNCWEIIKPDIICTGFVVHESICSILHNDCHEKYGWIDRDVMQLYESFCDGKQKL